MTADHPTPVVQIDLDEIGRHLDRLSRPPASGPNAFWQLQHDRDHAIGTARTLLAEFARRDAALADLTRQRDEAVARLQAQLTLQAEIDNLQRSADSWRAIARVYAINADEWRAKAERQAPVVEEARAYRNINRTVWTNARAAAIDEAYTALAAAVDALGPVDPEATDG